MPRKISVSRADGVVVVRAGGAIVAESAVALRLTEEGHDDVYYIPRADIAMEFLERSDRRTACPYKGEAIHFHLIAKSGPIADAAWSYEDPKPELAAIREMIAFYGDRAAVELL